MYGELIKLANHHPRVNILQPSTGVGGHCIAVDPWFIISQDPDNSFRIIKTARDSMTQNQIGLLIRSKQRQIQ